MARGTFEKNLNNASEKTVHEKKILFMLPNGAAGKKYMEEVTRLTKLWIQDTLLKSKSLKAVYVILALLFQNPTKLSKVKDHYQAPERGIKLWDESNIKGLSYKCMAIQQRLIYDPIKV